MGDRAARCARRAARRQLCLCGLFAALAILSLTPALAQAGSAAEYDETANQAVPCGVDAVVGSLRILGMTVYQAAIDDITSLYQPPNTMSLLDVTQILRSYPGVEAKVWEMSYDELQSLDQPFIVHLTGSGCSECPQGGHVVAVERLAGEWAIVQGVGGTSLAPAGQISSAFGGHAVLLSGPVLGVSVGPSLSVDSYVCDLGSVMAGSEKPCRLTIRNQGADLLAVRRVETDAGVRCLGAPQQLAPGEVGEIEVVLSPAHRLDRPLDTRTFFVQIHSNDPIRPRSSVALRCTVVEPVVPETPVLYLPRVSPSQAGERTISIECRDPVELVEAVPSHPALKSELTEAGKTMLGTRYSLRVTGSAESLGPGVAELPIQLKLKGVASEGAQLIARLRVWGE